MSRFRFPKGEAGRGNLRREHADRSCGKIRGINIHGDIVAAPVNALVSAINRNAEKAAKATALLAASSCGFYKTKSHGIKETRQIPRDKYGRIMPDTMPGAGFRNRDKPYSCRKKPLQKCRVRFWRAKPDAGTHEQKWAFYGKRLPAFYKIGRVSVF